MRIALYCKRIFQRKRCENPPLSRNCDWEDPATVGHCPAAWFKWSDGKAGRKIALKPGNFGIPVLASLNRSCIISGSVGRTSKMCRF